MSRKISFKWMERKISDKDRIGAMYCFKRCDVNVN